MSTVDPKIFKSYDIRGIYPSELNEDAAYQIGRAYAREIEGNKIAIGMDARISGPALKKSFIDGVMAEGKNIVDFGVVPIDAVYFAVGILKYPAGAVITASHNPKDYNGFKLPYKNAGWMRGKDLLEFVKDLPQKTSKKKGKVRQVDIMPKYIKHILSFIDLKKIKPFRVVVDAGNGVAGKVMPILEKHLPLKMTKLNFELDGNFPGHPSNPLLPESRVQIMAAIKETNADFGVIFDGDTDRLIFYDEKANFIPADLTLLVLAREFLKREPGSTIVYNAICSRVVPEKIKEWGGKAVRAKVGFINVREKMREVGGIVSGELSSHYSFRDNDYADSGFIALLILLQLLSKDGRPLSEIIEEFKKYYKADEINIEVSDWQKVIRLAKEKYRDGKQDELDGLTVEYEDWWFNVRPSNTEPLLRITIEANSQELLAEKTEDLADFVKKNNY